MSAERDPVSADHEIRRLADHLRVVSARALPFSEGDPYDTERYEQVRRVAAELFALVDVRGVDEIERTVLRELTHIGPAAGSEAAVFDDADRVLLIQRSDERLWAMPGGLIKVGETAAGAAVRETLEETGVHVEVLDLAAVYDSRFCGTRASIQLFHIVFHCRARGAPVERLATPNEVLDVAWFAPGDLPPLSAGHTVRVPDAIAFHGAPGRTWFDRPPGRN